MDKEEIKRIVLAADESSHARRAASYIAGFMGGCRGVEITVFHLVAEPPADFFGSEAERADWAREHEAIARTAVSALKDMLVEGGIEAGSVITRVERRAGVSPADAILDVAREQGACTVVVGRRGVSNREEFLFGSTSSALLHKAKGCAVWVVE